MHRRRFLRNAVSAGSGLALSTLFGGCLGDSLGTDGTATDACPNATRLSMQYESVERVDLVLRASADSITIGGSLSIRLRNLAAVAQPTGNRSKVDVQRDTDDGWQSVFGRSSNRAWTDEAISHEPGEGFDWRLSVEDSGFSFTDSFRPQYRRCDPVGPGRYRFVFWGIVGRADDESETTAGEEMEAALTCRFRVTEA